MRRYSAEVLGAFFLVLTFLSVSSRSGTDLSALTVSGVLVASVWAGAHISGAHFNPAVSLGVFLRGGMSVLDLVRYWVAQLLGALVAAVVALWIFPLHLGTAVVGRVGGLGGALAAEFVFTFALVYVVLSIGASGRQERNVRYGVAVGLVVLVGTLVVADVSGAAFNPAVAFGMSVDGEFGWPSMGVYLLTELLAGAAAAAVVARSASR